MCTIIFIFSCICSSSLANLLQSPFFKLNVLSVIVVFRHICVRFPLISFFFKLQQCSEWSTVDSKLEWGKSLMCVSNVSLFYQYEKVLINLRSSINAPSQTHTHKIEPRSMLIDPQISWQYRSHWGYQIWSFS